VVHRLPLAVVDVEGVLAPVGDVLMGRQDQVHHDRAEGPPFRLRFGASLFFYVVGLAHDEPQELDVAVLLGRGRRQPFRSDGLLVFCVLLHLGDHRVRQRIGHRVGLRHRGHEIGQVVFLCVGDIAVSHLRPDGVLDLVDRAEARVEDPMDLRRGVQAEGVDLPVSVLVHRPAAALPGRPPEPHQRRHLEVVAEVVRQGKDGIGVDPMPLLALGAVDVLVGGGELEIHGAPEDGVVDRRERHVGVALGCRVVGRQRQVVRVL